MDEAAATSDKDCSVKDILKRVERRHTESMSPSAMRRVDKELERQQIELENRACELEAEIERSLEDGQVLIVEGKKSELKQLVRRNAVIETDRHRFHNALQERLLKDSMIAKLGSPRRVHILEGVVLSLILLVLVLLYYEFITPNLTRETHITITLIDTLCCAVFLIDFFFRRSCADSKSWFWKRYWVDFVTSIPIPDAQLLRFGRLARVARVARAVRFLRLLRALRVIFFFWRGMDKLSEVLDVRLMKRSLMLGASLLVVGGFVIYWLEGRHQGVDSIGQSIWWSFTTVVTGGFPDIHNPISVSGRLLTVFLVLGGMTIVGIFTATLTSTLLGDDSAQLALMQKQLEEKLDRLTKQVDTMIRNKDGNEGSS